MVLSLKRLLCHRNSGNTKAADTDDDDVAPVSLSNTTTTTCSSQATTAATTTISSSTSSRNSSNSNSSSSSSSSIIRVSSRVESLHRKGLAPSTSHSHKSSNSSVRFGQVLIRDYERIAGDNPSVSMGVPIGLGWNYIEYDGIDLDDYEDNNSSSSSSSTRHRRSKAELVMSASIRQSLLLEEWHVSQKEIASCVRQCLKTKHQRRRTIVQGCDTTMTIAWFRQWQDKRNEKRIIKQETKQQRQQRDYMTEANNEAANSITNITNTSGSALDDTRHSTKTPIFEIDEEEEGSTAEEISLDYQQQCWDQTTTTSSSTISSL